MKTSVVISLYNEEAGVDSFWEVLKGVCRNHPDSQFELLWVNDGSQDKTQQKIDNICSDTLNNVQHVSIEFSKNFGHEAAMIAGIDNAEGDCIVCLDSDLQHPPTKIPEMVQEYQAGADIVLMERSSREDNGPIKRLFSKWFYKVINALSTFKFHPNSTDFFLLSRPVADILKENFRERNRFIRGFIQNLGFDKRILEFEAPAREHGESSYSYYALIKLAFNAIFSFSNKPLRLIILVAVLFVLFTILVGGYSLYMYISGDSPPSGYTTIILFLSASFSILFVLLTIFFLYFEKSIQETRQRPIYLIKKKK